VIRTSKNLQLVTVLISSPSEKMFTFSTLPITVVFSRFKLRPILSLLFLTHFISPIMSSLPSANTVVFSGFVTVFIFHVTFPIPFAVSPTPPNFIMHSLHRLNRPGDKIQPCLTLSRASRARLKAVAKWKNSFEKFLALGCRPVIGWFIRGRRRGEGETS
jgi:hypothetical protein